MQFQGKKHNWLQQVHELLKSTAVLLHDTSSRSVSYRQVKGKTC